MAWDSRRHSAAGWTVTWETMVAVPGPAQPQLVTTPPPPPPPRTEHFPCPKGNEADYSSTTKDSIFCGKLPEEETIATATKGPSSVPAGSVCKELFT